MANNTNTEPTIKQARFAEKYVEHGNAARAYREAGYECSKWADNTVYVEACRLLKNPKVTAKIDQLQRTARRKHNITLDGLTEQYERVMQMAEQKGDTSTMKAALDSLAKLHGVWVDKSENRDVTDQHTEAIREFARKKREQSNTNDRLH